MKKILGADMFNSILEEMCSFEGNVKTNMLQMCDKVQCRKILPQKIVDKIVKDVLEDTRMRVSVFGKHNFCQVNMKPYVELKQEME